MTGGETTPREGPIRRICRLEGINYRSFATRLGISPGYARQLGIGVRPPSSTLAISIVDTFPGMTTIEELLRWRRAA